MSTSNNKFMNIQYNPVIIVRTNNNNNNNNNTVNKYITISLSTSLQSTLYLTPPRSVNYKTLINLPIELLYNILIYTHASDICNIIQCNKYLFTNGRSNDVWYNVLLYHTNTLSINDRLTTNWLKDTVIHIQQQHEYNNYADYTIHRHNMKVQYSILFESLYDVISIQNKLALLHPVTVNQLKQCSIYLPLSLQYMLLYHNGQNSSELLGLPGLCYGCRLLTLDEIIDKKLNNTLYKDSEWLAFTDDSGSIRYCCNNEGHVYAVHGRHLSDYNYAAKSVFDFLTLLLNPFNR